MKKKQIPLSAKNAFTYEKFQEANKNILLCCFSEENTIESYKQLLFFNNACSESENILYFPSFDTSPYDRISPSSSIMMQRANVLTKLSQNTNNQKILVTNAQNLLCILPTPSVFKNRSIKLHIGMQISLEEISNFLVQNNFNRCANAVDSGEFAVRGEIIDIVAYEDHGYRINLSWNNIESIKKYDVYTQISQKEIDNLYISQSSESLITPETIITFKNNFLKTFGAKHTSSPLYQSIISGQKFHGYENLAPFFYKNTATIFDFLDDYNVIYDDLSIQSILQYQNHYEEEYQSRIIANKSNPESFYFAPEPSKLIYSLAEIKKILDSDKSTILEAGEDSKFTKIKNICAFNNLNDENILKLLLEIQENNKSKTLIIFCNSRVSLERIKKIIEAKEILVKKIRKFSESNSGFINITIAPLDNSFCNKTHLFLSEKDIFGNKFNTQSHKSSKRKLKNILTELDNISENEYIVHKDHGIGMFEKIQTLHVQGIAHDCLKIIYANNDILYLPVENIEQIKKYGNSAAILDKLGGVNWQKRKAKLKNRIKDIASSLIKLTAKRELTKANLLEFDKLAYDKFCNEFPYNETEDQISAINDVQSDLESGKIMDRLICGDVGFGKTEVAMRAAFMVAFDINDDSPQIAIITPTTILCKQHYTSFLKRFKNIGLNIAQLSRLVKPSVSKKVKEDLKSGEINIIIGTHALLSDNIGFKNLKMIIVDEEQNFGVTQKEKLKKLKNTVHVLSLSATPIPRTLQMSMSGIKDLSLIATPPIDRLPVRTNIIPFDPLVIREILINERSRGGLSFYVAPRIADIEWIAKQLDKIIPELKYEVAHGQMTPSKIDSIMSDFCEGKFDVLLSTTIIESGIDIPIANTMIIHKSDMLGLSQLYQLRGRVGRGKVRGHAYLLLDHKKKTNKHSLQKLEILQNIDSLGAGFTIASHDMDIRGFGNLLGSEQSGQIKEVGTELYQDMLDEEINKLKQEGANSEEKNFSPSIKLNIPVLIPFTYIEDSSLRLAIYRRTADLKNRTEIENFENEMIDRFGPIPEEFSNLLNVVKIKNICLKLGIENLDAGKNGFVIKFNKNFDVSDMVFAFIKKHPRTAQIKPDDKLIFIKQLKDKNILNETENLLKILNYN